MGTFLLLAAACAVQAQTFGEDKLLGQEDFEDFDAPGQPDSWFRFDDLASPQTSATVTALGDTLGEKSYRIIGDGTGRGHVRLTNTETAIPDCTTPIPWNVGILINEYPSNGGLSIYLTQQVRGLGATIDPPSSTTTASPFGPASNQWRITINETGVVRLEIGAYPRAPSTAVTSEDYEVLVSSPLTTISLGEWVFVDTLVSCSYSSPLHARTQVTLNFEGQIRGEEELQNLVFTGRSFCRKAESSNDNCAANTRLDGITFDRMVVHGHSADSSFNMRIDNLEWNPTVPPAPTLTASATRAVDSLQNMQVDRLGTSLITREDASRNVTTYSGGTLAAGALKVDTNCNRVDMISITPQALMFGLCLSDPAELDELRIRSHTMGAPVKPSGCAAWCRDTFEVAWLSGDVEDLRNLKSVVGLPYDYSMVLVDDDGEAGVVFLLFVYTVGPLGSNPGHIGVMSIGMSKGPDRFASVHVERVLDGSAVASPGGVCTTTHPGTSNPLIVGVTENGASKVWELTLEPTQEPSGPVGPSGLPTPILRPNMVFVRNLPGSASNADDIACGGGKYVVFNDDAEEVVVGDVFTGSVIEKYPANGGARVAMDPFGAFFAYWDADGVTVRGVADANQTILARMEDVPAGARIDLGTDGNMQNVWAASTSAIHRWSTFAVTSIDEVGTGVEADQIGVPTPTPTADPGSIRDQQQRMAESLGVSETAADVFVGVLFVSMLTVGLASGLFFVTRNARAGMFGAIAGFALGLALGWVFGYFPNLLMFVVILIAAAGAFFWLRGRGGGD